MAAAIAARNAHQREDANGDPAGLDAGEFCCFRVAADREDIAAEAQAGGDEGHDDADDDGDQDRNGNAVGDVQAGFGPGNVVRFGISLGDVDRPVIAVGDPDRAEDQHAAESAERNTRPRADGAGSRSACAGGGS